MSYAEKERLETMAASNNKTLSAFLRDVLFADGSIQSKIDFYANINQQMEALQKQGLIINQIIYQLLVKTIGEKDAENLVEQIEKYVTKQ
jgi:hypothetical protein